MLKGGWQLLVHQVDQILAPKEEDSRNEKAHSMNLLLNEWMLLRFNSTSYSKEAKRFP
ncbi:hypothetical protein [Halobacillus dabanensis]|uniref:hypothetical protein n=1 Tax=Halobacillus dabanensis TaxID=240302 RepID=UPI0014288BC7|nr:hypothetical protein [Halobacillus dabanensis]